MLNLSRIQLNSSQKWMIAGLSGLFGILLLSALLWFRKDNILFGLLFLMMPFVLGFAVMIFRKPVTGIYSVLVINYFVMGMARYLPGPLGLAVDGVLVLTWVSLFFSQFNNKVKWSEAVNDLTMVTAIWSLYVLFQLFNPEAVSRMAWFYAMRGIALYMLLTIPLTFLLFNREEYLNRFILIWAVFTLAGVLKGIMQLYPGPDPWEQRWLAQIGGKTHLLPQGLRVFSFFTDAATYGGSMAYSGVVFSIISTVTKKTTARIFYLFVAAAAFYGMFISGTRGALAVPFAGFSLYALLSKKIKILVTGAVLLVLLYSFLKFSTAGSSIYAIRRFRTALDKDNPSLMVRKENQKLLKVYLKDRPFGGGIGSAGNWGLRFSPDTFLARTPTDSWYVQIWAEQGRVGLMLHLLILIYIIGKASFLILFRIKDKELSVKAIALTSGIFGVMAASYGSSALGQMPNGIIVYMSMAFLFMMPGWERKRIPDDSPIS